MTRTFTLDGREVPFVDGQSVLQAALAEGIEVPHLCAHPEFKPHGSCRVCTVKVNGHPTASCTCPAKDGLLVESETPELRELRRGLVQLLFVEGNHFCPSCEKSGDCKLQRHVNHLSRQMETANLTSHLPERQKICGMCSSWF